MSWYSTCSASCCNLVCLPTLLYTRILSSDGFDGCFVGTTTVTERHVRRMTRVSTDLAGEEDSRGIIVLIGVTKVVHTHS